MPTADSLQNNSFSEADNGQREGKNKINYLKLDKTEVYLGRDYKAVAIFKGGR